VEEQRKAVVLLSGGMDSSTTLAVAKAEGFLLHALTFRYGQRHEVEVEAAKRIGSHIGVTNHLVLDIDLRAFGASSLTDDIPVPKDRLLDTMGDTIPITYVPARNTIFLSFALGWAEVLDAQDIFIGVNSLDYSGYPDCRPEYIEAYQRMADLATRAGTELGRRIEIHTPLIDASKKEIILRGLELGVDFSLTVTCYDPTAEAVACGRCDACQLRLAAFSEVGLSDPCEYRDQIGADR